MDMSPAWLSEMEMEYPGFMNYDSFSTESYTENMTFIYQSFQTQQPEIEVPGYEEMSSSCINKCSPTPDPLIATNLPSSNTFTISFGDLKPRNAFHDSLGYEAGGTTKVPTTTRNHFQAQDHVLAERKRREKLNRHFTSLSALLPNLKKMDKTSVLEDASKYIRELQARVKELEESPETKRKNVQESSISLKRSRLCASDDEYYLSDETNSEESNARRKISPEIEVRISGSSVLVRIQCQKNFSSLINAINHMQKLGLSVTSSSAMPFVKTTLIITIIAQLEDDFCMTSTELMKSIQLVI